MPGSVLYRWAGLAAVGLLLCVGCAAAGDPYRAGRKTDRAVGGTESPRYLGSVVEDPLHVSMWLTDPESGVLFEEQPAETAPASGVGIASLVVDPARRYQEIDGFGFALTGGSAMLLNRMSGSKRQEVLSELFGTGSPGIGVSYLRLSIGASDLSDRVFSYSDLSHGETDPELHSFSLGPDREDVIPILKEILAIYPDLGILASPWSPPVWMKSNGQSVGGRLLPEFHDVYARYFVKYIQAMGEEGITVDAVTVQNEPLHPGNNPSLLMPASEQALFVGHSLGPAFEAAGITTKIIIYDHNADRIDYPLEVLADPVAARYVDGTAFHLYAGDISALSTVRSAHPDKNIYFTEQWIGAPGDMTGDLIWHIRNLIIGATRNWARTVIEWNLASDPNQDPHTDGGCSQCLGALTIDGDEVVRNPAFYVIAHASRFVRPGSVRIHSEPSGELPNVAFLTPSGEIVVIVLNDSGLARLFNVRVAHGAASARLPARSVATFVISPDG